MKKLSYVLGFLYCLFFGRGLEIQAYTLHDLLASLVQTPSHISHTAVQSPTITPTSHSYQLVQAAIDQGIIANKSIPLDMDRVLTYDSLKSWSSIFLGLRLDIAGDEPVDPTTWKQILDQIRDYRSLTPTKSGSDIPLLDVSSLYAGQRTAQGVDRYHKVYTGSQKTQFEQRLQGKTIGIGITVEKNTIGGIVVTQVQNGPAKQAGIQRGDRILQIGTMTIDTKTTRQAVVRALEGELGSEVFMTIQRGQDTHQYRITRESLILDPISMYEWDQDTIFMKIHHFQTNTYESFLQKIESLAQYDVLILDLRGNLGGSLDDATNILHHFVSENSLLYHIQQGKMRETITSLGLQPAIRPNLRIVILIDQHTASASELLAGVLREHFPSVQLIGTQSYGKGTIQTVMTTDDQQMYKRTTGTWLLGISEQSMDRIGLTPDVVMRDEPDTDYDDVLMFLHESH